MVGFTGGVDRSRPQITICRSPLSVFPMDENGGFCAKVYSMMGVAAVIVTAWLVC